MTPTTAPPPCASCSPRTWRPTPSSRCASSSAPGCASRTASSTREASFAQALREFAPDVILSDFSMPRFDGMAALAHRARALPRHALHLRLRHDRRGVRDPRAEERRHRLRAEDQPGAPAGGGRARARRGAGAPRRGAAPRSSSRSARERLTSIFTSLPDVLWSVDAHERPIIYVEPGGAGRASATPPDEFLAQPQPVARRGAPRGPRRACCAAWERRARDGEPFDIDYRAVRPDGEVRWINDRGRRSATPAARSSASTAWRATSPSRSSSAARIERLSRIRELLGTLNSAIVRMRERDALFDEFCRIAVSRGGFTLARIIELDTARQGRARGDHRGRPGAVSRHDRRLQPRPGARREPVRRRRCAAARRDLQRPRQRRARRRASAPRSRARATTRSPCCR